MSNVTLRIGGREYAVACADGEEDHVAGLGQMIAEKVDAMGNAGQTEPRQLLFAALLLADELFEARNTSAREPIKNAPHQPEPQAVPTPQPVAQPAPTPAPTGPDPAALEALADRLEALVSALEDSGLSA